MTTETPIKPYPIAEDRAYSLAEHEGQPARWWLGGHVAIKARAANTDGRFCQLEFTDPCGMAPPVHIHHREDETFYVLEGHGERVHRRFEDRLFARASSCSCRATCRTATSCALSARGRS